MRTSAKLISGLTNHIIRCKNVMFGNRLSNVAIPMSNVAYIQELPNKVTIVTMKDGLSVELPKIKLNKLVPSHNTNKTDNTKAEHYMII